MSHLSSPIQSFLSPILKNTIASQSQQNTENTEEKWRQTAVADDIVRGILEKDPMEKSFCTVSLTIAFEGSAYDISPLLAPGG